MWTETSSLFEMMLVHLWQQIQFADSASGSSSTDRTDRVYDWCLAAVAETQMTGALVTEAQEFEVSKEMKEDDRCT